EKLSESAQVRHFQSFLAQGRNRGKTLSQSQCPCSSPQSLGRFLWHQTFFRDRLIFCSRPGVDGFRASPTRRQSFIPVFSIGGRTFFTERTMALSKLAIHVGARLALCLFLCLALTVVARAQTGSTSTNPFVPPGSTTNPSKSGTSTGTSSGNPLRPLTSFSNPSKSTTQTGTSTNPSKPTPPTGTSTTNPSTVSPQTGTFFKQPSATGTTYTGNPFVTPGPGIQPPPRKFGIGIFGSFTPQGMLIQQV